MGRAESVRFSSDRQKVILSVRGVAVEADLRTKTAKITGSKEPVPADLMGDKEALDLVRSYYSIPENQRRRLFDLARVLSDVA